jgi:hypothetical protein
VIANSFFGCYNHVAEVVCQPTEHRYVICYQSCVEEQASHAFSAAFVLPHTLWTLILSSIENKILLNSVSSMA